MNPTLVRFLAVFVALSCSSASYGALTVRVDASHGAPRLVVNGQPIRARMFWGDYRSPNPAPLAIRAGEQMVSFDFTALVSEPDRATMHFRFGQTPGDVDLDNVQVVDLDTKRDALPTRDFEGGQASFGRDWAVWPLGEDNTVGTVQVEPGVGQSGSAGLHIHVQAPPNGKWPDFHVHHQEDMALVKGHRYRVSFWIRADKPRGLTVAFYRPGSTFVYLGGPTAPDVFASQIRLAARANVRFVSWGVWSLPWPVPGELADWTGVDKGCDAILQANPSALLIPRISINPPAWWQKAHSEEMMRWEDSPGGNHPNVPVPASPIFQRDAGARLTALIGHMESKYGEHVAGYHVAGQNTDEWFYQDSWGHALNGYAPADLSAWRQWLRGRYQTDAALQAAWADPTATLDTVAVPSPAARHAAPNGIFRDPETEHPILDFSGFQQQAMAGCLCTLAHAARVASRGHKLILAFYGYGFEFGPMQTGPASSGHYALRRVLDCPDIDVLCSPISYFDRGPDGSAPTMTTSESVALAGKMKLNEDDTATFLSQGTAPGSDVKVTTLAETVQELRRNVAQEAIRNLGTWWMDLGGIGWFNDPGLWAEMSRLDALDAPLLNHPVPFRPEVAAVLDERSVLRLAEGADAVTGPGIYEVRKPLGLLGAPYGQYLLDDVAAGRVPAKAYVFLNAWCLSASQRSALLRATRGHTRVWCYAPGLYDDDRRSPAAMQALTGFALTQTSQQAWATPTALGRSLGLTQSFGLHQPLQPLFAAADARPDEVLATYADGSAAVALRRTPGGPSLFVGVPGLTSELLRVAARTAGVHLFTQRDAHVYANGPFLVVHAAQAGPLMLDTGRTGPIVDVLSGRTVGQGPRLSVILAGGESRILRIAP